MRLTEHFSLADLARSDTALRLGIDNTPSPEVIANASLTARMMEKIRAVLGAAIFTSSWFRCEALEWVLCAKDYSAWCIRHAMTADELAWRQYFRLKGHPQGWCVDFTAPNFGSPRQIIKQLKGSGIKFDQLIEEGNWVHASADPRMRGEVLTAIFKDGVPTYTMGLT